MRTLLSTMALLGLLAFSNTSYAASGHPVLHGSTVHYGSAFPLCQNFHTADGDPAWYGVDTSQVGAGGAAGIISTSDVSQLAITFQTYCGVMSPGACPGNVVPICHVQWQ